VPVRRKDRKRLMRGQDCWCKKRIMRTLDLSKCISYNFIEIEKNPERSPYAILNIAIMASHELGRLSPAVSAELIYL